MQTESSPNYYYRYKIREDQDLSDDTIQRRQRKISHSGAKRVLFDWTNDLSFNLNQLVAAEKITSLPQTHLFTLSQFEENLCHLQKKKANLLHIQIKNSEQVFDLQKLCKNHDYEFPLSLYLSPVTKPELFSFRQDFSDLFFKFESYFWNFASYNQKIRNSLTTEDIGHFISDFPKLSFFTVFRSGLPENLEIWNDLIPNHFELEADNYRTWFFATPTKDIQLSVVIPSFNNCHFLTNVIRHLLMQDIQPERYEIIIVEDGGSDRTVETIQLLLKNYQHQVNLRLIYWSKDHPHKGEQTFFRAGLARNLGVRYSQAEKIVFLDSDILIPADFVSLCISELTKSDLIQFQRFHIHQQLSLQNPNYRTVDQNQHTYIEEKRYWSQFFFCDNWNQLENYWKYTCTYALGINKKDFLACGRFKKYYVSYGFEDTDLGYEMHCLSRKFKLIQRPLFHLTAYDKMQYQNSQFKRTKLLKKTAQLFFRQHLDPDIFNTLRSFYRFEKPFLRKVRDLL